jgi:hypothetical protein
MSVLIPDPREKGKYAFRPSQQSRGAASSRPALSKGRGRGKGRGKGKGKEKEPEQEQEPEQERATDIDMELCDSISSFLSPSTAPTSLFPLSTSASTSPSPVPSTGSGSKRKSSALDDDISVISTSSKKPSGTDAIIQCSNNVAEVSVSIRDLTAERKLMRLHHEACARAEAAHAMPPSPARRVAALHQLQQSELDLDVTSMVTIGNHIMKNTVAADAYMSWDREDYRKAWVTQTLDDISKAAAESG